MKLILLGAPGCGKGTQAGYISKKYDLPHVSTGDIFRENIKNMTPIGVKVKAVMDTGNLCPDDLTVEIVKDRLEKPDCNNGYLLDGFPRNLFQAEQLDKFNTPDKVINIEVNFDKIEKRITGRRSCDSCKGSFHIDFIGDTDCCPDCGAKLIIRKDDNVETVKERLEVYKHQTEPLVEFYTKQNKILNIDGDASIDDVFKQIVKALENDND